MSEDISGDCIWKLVPDVVALIRAALAEFGVRLCGARLSLVPAHQDHRRFARLLVHIAQPMPGVDQRRRRRLRPQSVDGLWPLLGRAPEAPAGSVVVLDAVVGSVHRADDVKISKIKRVISMRSWCSSVAFSRRRHRARGKSRVGPSVNSTHRVTSTKRTLVADMVMHEL